MLSKQYKTIIFDFDYTLIDATKAIVECYNYAFSKVGFPPQETETIKKTVGITISKSFTIMTGCEDNEIIDNFKEHFKEKADKVMTNSTEFLKNALNLLKLLKQNNIKIGILSSKYAYRIKEFLEKENAIDLIEIIIGFEDLQEHKPLPQGLEKIADILNIGKNEILYVGDSLTDAETAKNAKVDFIGVLTGTTTKADFESYPYIAVVRDLFELEKLLLVES